MDGEDLGRQLRGGASCAKGTGQRPGKGELRWSYVGAGLEK